MCRLIFDFDKCKFDSKFGPWTKSQADRIQVETLNELFILAALLDSAHAEHDTVLAEAKCAV